MAIEQVVQKLENRYESCSAYRTRSSVESTCTAAVRTQFDTSISVRTQLPQLLTFKTWTKKSAPREAALDDPLSATGFQQWADWALSQADRIDPVLSAASEQFKTTIEARQRRLILGGAGGSCEGLLRVGDRRK